MRFTVSRTRLYVALALALAPAAFAWMVSSAGAEPWGERGVFKPKQLTEEAGGLNGSRLVKPKFAAGPNGAYYVLMQSQFVGKFVLQRFHEGELQASTEIEPPPVTKKEEEIEAGEAENAALAVDPNPNGEAGRERVYVLFVYGRRGQDEKEETEDEKEQKQYEKEVEEETDGKKTPGSRLIKTPYERFPLDSEMQAAGSLYAFTYNGASKTLVSAKTEGTKKVPAPALTREAMHAQAEEKHATKTEPNPPELEPLARPFLDPRGMTVDPATGDLAISGNEDEAPMEKVDKGEEEKQCHSAVQFVSVKTGSEPLELSLGARYVDEAGMVLFGQTGCGEAESSEESGVDRAPASPVFAPDGSVLGYSELEELGVEPELKGVIWQLTPKGADEHSPDVVSMSPKALFLPEGVEPFEAEVGAEQPAAVMSLVPESSTAGTIYLSGRRSYGGSEPAPAVLHYSDPSGDDPSIGEVGWTAGGRESEDRGAGPCNLHVPSHEPLMLGGLSGSKRGFLALTFYEEKEHETNVPRAEVVEFGEGGGTTGCPTAPVTKPTQSYQGQPTSEVQAGAELKITSVLGAVEEDGAVIPAAGAKSVTWKVKFTPPVGAGETSETTVTYENKLENFPDELTLERLPNELTLERTFAKAGTYEITDVVHTDDLADETAQPEEGGKPVADKLTVTPGKLEVKPEVPEPATVIAHEKPVLLKVEPKLEGVEELDVTNVVWEFPAEGTKVEETASRQLAKGEKLSLTHTFGRCGATKSTKCDVNVTVAADGETAKTQLQVTVQESKAEEEAEGGPPPPGETTPTTTTTTPTTTTPTTTTPTATTTSPTTTTGGGGGSTGVLGIHEGGAKPPTRAQLLAKALVACKKQPKKKRAKCEALARKKYGPKHKSKKKHKKSKR